MCIYVCRSRRRKRRGVGVGDREYVSFDYMLDILTLYYTCILKRNTSPEDDD